jgi:2-dehydropantoate 2-reductase
VERSQHIGFIGAGAAGSFVGGMLARRGFRVTLVDAWPEHIAAIKNQGLRVSGTHGDFTVHPAALHVNEVHKLARDPLGIAFISSKAYDTEWTAALVKDYLQPHAVVVSLQNGFNEARIRQILPDKVVLGCIASTLGAEILGAGHVTRACLPGGEHYTVFRIGDPDRGHAGEVERIVSLMSEVDTTAPTDNLYGERWSKLVANAMVNPLAAITGLRDRAMNADADVRSLSMQLAIEGVRVGRAVGYRLVPVFGIPSERWLAAADGGELTEIHRDMGRFSSRATDDSRSSTPVDIELGRRTELEFFNGLIISKGRELGIPTPVNESTMEVVRLIETGELAPSVGNLRMLNQRIRLRSPQPAS